jgi:outer membrane protein OmpA-like peptidoglycan-associated protein
MMTLFQKFDESLTDELIEKLKGLGERNLGDTKGAIYAIFYTLLAGLIRRANSDMSTNMLVSQIKRINDKDLKDFSLETGFANEKSLKEFVNLGEKHMSQIFPSFKSQLLNLVTTYSGTSKSETAKYTGFVNGLIIKLLAEKLESGTSKDELMNYLKEHRDTLFDKAPEDFVEKMIPALGLHDLRSMKMYYAKKKEEKENSTSREGNDNGSENVTVEDDFVYEEDNSSMKKILLITGIVALVGLLGYFIYDSREEIFGSDEQAESSVIEIPDEALIGIDSTNLAVTETGDSGWLALKEILSSENINENNEIKIESLSFSGDSTDLSNSSNPFIDSLVTVFKANPRFQIQIKGGHKIGNSQIAIKRAFSLKRILQAKGVNPIKIDGVSDAENLDYLKLKVISK